MSDKVRRPFLRSGSMLGFYALTLAAGAALVSCTTSATLGGRESIASAIAEKGGLSPIHLDAPPFILSGYAKISDHSTEAHIYIEGDGQAWLSKSQPSMNPTPTDPLALRLAAKDSAGNVFYLARPCQYSGKTDGTACERDYWMGRRYAPEVLESYNAALDELKVRYRVSHFHLIGYSGGATVAALLSGQRRDIATLRSVAGNLDHETHSRVHNVSRLSASLNPPQYAQALAQIAQYHFIGSDDEIVPAQIYRSYSTALPAKNCTSFTIVEGASHTDGWVERWSELLRLKPVCK